MSVQKYDLRLPENRLLFISEEKSIQSLSIHNQILQTTVPNT